VGLLGEAVGIRLPRHVRSFLAELPGVGPALSAAFSATAVLFIAKALVELSKKLSETLAEFIYSKSVMEEHQKSVVDLNNVLLALGKQYEELKKKADDYGKSALQLATENKGQVKQSITELNKELKAEEDQFKALIKSENEHLKVRLGLSQAYGLWKSESLGVLDALKGLTFGIDSSIVKHKEEDAINNKVLETNKKLAVAHQELRVATNNVTTAQDELNKKGAALEEQITKSANEINKLNIALNHTKVEASDLEIITPAQIRNMLQGVAAAHQYSITLKGDLVQALQAARKAEWDFVQSGIQDSVARKQLAHEVDNARKALENYGKAEDTFKIKSHGLWKEFQQDAKDGATTMDNVKQLGVTAFDGLSKGMESALQQAILSQGSFAQALEKATAAALASVASQAIIKALFYTGEGFAAMAGFEEQSASQYFTAAGIMGAVGAAAGLAAHAIAGASGGGGSSSGSTAQLHTSQSNTTSQAGSGSLVSGVQHFATGGLITAPTLAMMGESFRKEAVLPLEDPQAMQEVGKAIGGAGGSQIHVHVEGMISPDNLTKVVDQINRRVNRGQLHLKATDTLRVTKRGA